MTLAPALKTKPHNPLRGPDPGRSGDGIYVDAHARTDGDGDGVSIGEIAREFGVTLRTLRFYEDRGLLQPKRIGAMRIYGPREKARLTIILRGKRLGFTLSEIKSMIAAEEDKATIGLKLQRDQIAQQLEHLRRQRAEIDEAIATLERAMGR